MASVPDPDHVKPWYLRNITEALALDEASGNVYVRTGITGDIIIEGNVEIPGTVTVNSSAEDPVHIHLDEVGTSGILNVPYLPIGGNVVVTSGNINANVTGSNVGLTGNLAGITGNVNIGTMPAITGNVNANITGGNVNATVTGTVTVSTISSNVTVVDGGGSLTIDGNVGITGNVNIGTMPNVNANITGGNVTVTQGTDPWTIEGNVNATLNGDANVIISGFGGATSDAFGRLRVSEPFTLFDTNSRYYDHNQFSSAISGIANVVYVGNQSSFQLNVGTSNGDSVIRETLKVFPYQPGKSQLSLLTFCMNTPKTNLRQRVGLFGADNGVFFENDGTYNYMVIRSGSTGAEERVRQDAWNGDRLNGAGGANNPSGITLYPNRTQIYYADVEWLGVGNVRVGFIINGAYILCHTFQHANQTGNTKVYMTTATLPIRYEITNTGATASASQMTQICSTVISEGGYNSFGTTQSAGTGTTQKRLTNANTYYPVVSIRLAPTRLDSIVLPRQIDVLSPSVNYYRWVLLQNPTLTGATWQAQAQPVQFNMIWMLHHYQVE